MNINEKECANRKEEFFTKLQALIAEFPELHEQYSFDLEMMEMCEGDHSDFNPELPKIVTGIVLCLAVRNSDDWEQLFWTAPYGQSTFVNVGMVHGVLGLVK